MGKFQHGREEESCVRCGIVAHVIEQPSSPFGPRFDDKQIFFEHDGPSYSVFVMKKPVMKLSHYRRLVVLLRGGIANKLR